VDSPQSKRELHDLRAEPPLRIDEWEGGISFDILVAPRASRARVGPAQGDRVKVAVTAPPVEGRANEAVVALLAAALGVRKRDVAIVAGESGRRKRVSVAGATRGALLALIEAE
jgi:uncharacterized protein (TIGR00251 family)